MTDVMMEQARSAGTQGKSLLTGVGKYAKNCALRQLDADA